MIKKYKKYRRTLWGLVTALMAFAFVTLMGQQSESSNDLSNGAKRLKIESLYDGYKTRFPDVLDLSPRQAMSLIDDQKAVFIDIREAEERRVSMLPAAISVDEFLGNHGSYDDHVKIAYCTISSRSGKFAEKYQNEGIPVYNLRGGALAWVHAGGKIYDQTGETYQIHVHSREWNLAPEQYAAVW